MKTITTLFILVLMGVLNTLQAQERTITATVVNVTSNNGMVSFALFTKDNFLKQPIKSLKAKIKNGKSTIVFNEVLSGEYAVVCFHDKNENGKMDFSSNGMPIEDYGASNNIMTMGPPEYEQAKFEVNDTDIALEIKF